MTYNKLLLFIFIPLILLAGGALFVRIVQYEPLIPDFKEQTEKKLQVPIFPEDPIIGDKKAAVTIIAFEDFGCESCRLQSEMLEDIMEKNPLSAKIIWKLMPISRFPQDTTKASEYAFCAHEQGKFNEFKKFAFENSGNLSDTILETIASEMELDTDKLQECLKSPRPKAHIDSTKSLAKLLNIQALPTMFINNKQIQLPTNQAGWETLLGL